MENNLHAKSQNKDLPKLLQIQISKPKYTELLCAVIFITTHKAQLHQNHNLSAKLNMQEKNRQKNTKTKFKMATKIHPRTPPTYPR
jgi:hypothetical protein